MVVGQRFLQLLDVELATGEPVERSDQSTRPGLALDMPFNRTADVIHSCTYKAQPDVACVLHVHVPCIVAPWQAAKKA